MKKILVKIIFLLLRIFKEKKINKNDKETVVPKDNYPLF